jgi:hypothetical protein
LPNAAKSTEKSAPVDYTVWILHTRPETCVDTEFLLSYSAKDVRGKAFVEEKFVEAFKTAHPNWVIKKVTVQER